MARQLEQDTTEVDAWDANTLDRWIKRHPDMLRNIDAHPFNSEPPLKNLQAADWIALAASYVSNPWSSATASMVRASTHDYRGPKACEHGANRIW